MIDWADFSHRLAVLARSAAPGQMLSVTLPVPELPALAVPSGGDWVFWQRPEGKVRLMGFGRACAMHSAGPGRFAALRAAAQGLLPGWHHDGGPPLAFTGFAFGPQGGAPLPNASLWVPDLLLREESGGGAWLTLSCAAGQVSEAVARARRHWQRAVADAAVAGIALPVPGPSLHPHPLAETAFLARGAAALREIESGRVDKLVLTRSLHLSGPAPFVPQRILDALANRQPACAIFGVGRDGGSFVGASPETLLALTGEQVQVDALAGTVWREATLALGARKNRREHDFVVREITAALATICDEIDVPSAAETMQLDTLAHLRRRILARRTPAVTAFDLLARLHPTPAVGGAPTPAALDWLASHGETRAAWYTGGIGWIDAAGDCDIAVALRCGWVEGKTATLYAGAGFVAGSDPAQELAETEAKLQVMRTALAEATGRAAGVCSPQAA